ncbi:hypothetical protein NQ314_012597 [Rhamnusium bicolor]|uniref:DUF4219 domain-containing protein n=1 Tax=Rhamnusium bicolor TaxID=1586634 RepID=A0AAV8XAF0_9CUCU|nr:hypothetical protein NQ314_012597 [Rhamnusium bicolor]
MDSDAMVARDEHIDKLTGSENYYTWQFAIRNVLDFNGWDKCILATDHSDYETNAEKLRKSKAKISLSVDPSVQSAEDSPADNNVSIRSNEAFEDADEIDDGERTLVNDPDFEANVQSPEPLRLQRPARVRRPVIRDMGSKYQFFQDDFNIILDVYEERLKYSNILEEEKLEVKDPFEGLNLQRGKNGVYEIEDLVNVLRHENSEDVLVVKLAQEIKYVDYICVVSGKSQKHMQAIAQFVKKLYKQKRHKK